MPALRARLRLTFHLLFVLQWKPVRVVQQMEALRNTLLRQMPADRVN